MFVTMRFDAVYLMQMSPKQEGDMACKRNAFIILYAMEQTLAIQYLISVFDQVQSFDEHLQLAIVELIRKDCRGNHAEKVSNLLHSLHIKRNTHITTRVY